MENQDTRIEKKQAIIEEALAMLKIGALASVSCIIDEDLQMRDDTDYYRLFWSINTLLINIRHTLDKVKS